MNFLSEGGPNLEEIAALEATEAKEISNPAEWIHEFVASEPFKNAYDRFYEGKKLAEDVTEEEKMQVFCKRETAELALYEFHNQGHPFKYDSSQFSSEAAEKFKPILNLSENHKKR